MSNHSRVRGPSSALTEFLRSRGISIQNRGRLPPVEPAATRLDHVATTSEEAVPDEDVPAGATASIGLSRETELTVSTSRKKRATKKRKKDEEDDVYEPEEGESIGRSGFSHKSRPRIGQIDFCAICNSRFTVTQYSKAAPDGNLLCNPCASDVWKHGKTSQKPRSRMARRKKNQALLDNQVHKFPKLQDLMISLIARHIGDIDALGDIGDKNLSEICQIISRNRSLTNDTVSLFLDSSHTKLHLYDCAKLSTNKLRNIAQLCPLLEELNLSYCGTLDDEVLGFYAQHLQRLRSITLKGCFLVTVQSWKQFFQSVGGRLERFEISNTSRFDAETTKVMVQHCPNIKHLSLNSLSHLDDDCIISLATLEQLEHVSFAYTSQDISDAALVTFLSFVGYKLRSFNISGYAKVTDTFLLEGLLLHCTKLQNLYLNECDLLTDNGLAQLFERWRDNGSLLELELSRCSLLKDGAVNALMQHSKSKLRRLVLNSLEEVSHECIAKLVLPLVVHLDISWIRAVDDLAIQEICSHAPELKTLLVFGNNRITDVVQVPKGVAFVGREREL